MANSRSGESVLQRAMRILEAFDVDHPRLTSADIHRRAGLPQSTAHRLANEMCDVGMLQRLPNDVYIISPHAWEMFVRSNPLERLRVRAQPVMENVHSTLHQYVCLATPDFEQRTVLFIESLDSRRDVIILGKNATRLDMHQSALGLVMLAFAEDEDIELALGRPLRDSITGAHADLTEIRSRLPEIRRAGYTHIIGGMVAENTAIAVPVFGPQQTVIAALGVIAKTENFDSEEAISTLVAGGKNLSLSLRHLAEPPFF